jgi:predicted O-methyltransferase YrrM
MIAYEELKKRGLRGFSPGEGELLGRHAEELRPKRILEIGSRRGTSTLLLGDIARRAGGRLQCIEPNPKREWAENVGAFDLTDTVEMIVGRSPWVDLGRIARPLDLLYIDGDHSTRAAMLDYYYWSPMVRPGGLIAVHDIHHRTVRRALDVIEATDGDLLEELGRARGGNGMLVWRRRR